MTESAWNLACVEPLEGQIVIVHGGIAQYSNGVFYTGMECPQFTRRIKWEVTHWMPLPQPPVNDNPKSSASSPGAMCRCGHSKEAHEGHTYQIDGRPPNHCSACRCAIYSPEATQPKKKWSDYMESEGWIEYIAQGEIIGEDAAQLIRAKLGQTAPSESEE